MAMRSCIDNILRHLVALRKTITTSLGRKGEEGEGREDGQVVGNVVDFCNFGISSCHRFINAFDQRVFLHKHRRMDSETGNVDPVRFAAFFEGMDFDILSEGLKNLGVLLGELDCVTRYKAAGVEWQSVVSNITDPDLQQVSPWLALSQDRARRACQGFHYKLTWTVKLGEMTELVAVIPELAQYIEGYCLGTLDR
ncbi:hypothetical protein QBC41DRAFT_380170 [Cercophora samala]|uniref:Uncharacterized protein n=1 Tax=Cercophora samala TaxID=330535 RepID=A0AA39Z672_9PEZI|nr:hypothetical protein QBC41DRAFT_380170 [Cercophora samala]